MATVAIGTASAQRILPETGVLAALPDAETESSTIGFAASGSDATSAIVLRMPRRVLSDTVTELQTVQPDGSVRRLFTGTIQPQPLAAGDGQIFAMTMAGREPTCHLIDVSTGDAKQFACGGTAGRAALTKGRLALLQYAPWPKLMLNIYRTVDRTAAPVLEASFPMEKTPWMKPVFASPDRLLLLDPSSALTITPYVFADGRWTKSADTIALSGPEVDKTRASSPAQTGNGWGAARLILVPGAVTARDGSLLLVMSGAGREDPGPYIVAFDADGKETASYRPAGDRKLLRPSLAYVSGDSIVFFDRSGVRHRFERP